MAAGKWHLRKVRGQWQGMRYVGHRLEIRMLAFPPAFFMCPKHGPMAEEFESWIASKAKR